MIINFYGEGCFKLQEGDTSILIDPIDSSSGLSAPKSAFATIVLKTLLEPPKPGEELPEGEKDKKIISGAGEYEIKGITINGWPLLKDSSDKYIKNVFQIKWGDLTFGVLGHISEFNEPEILEELGEVDVLFIPGGGKPFLAQASAAKLVRQINPKVVVPSFFKLPGLKRKADPVDAFLKELGMKNKEPQEKLSIKKKDLSEKTEVVVLSA